MNLEPFMRPVRWVCRGLRSFFERLFSFDTTSTWIRFLLIPLIVVLVLLLMMPLGGLLENFVDFMITEAPSRWEGLLDAINRLVRGPVQPPTDEALQFAFPGRPGTLARLRNWFTEVGGETFQLALLFGLGIWFVFRLMSHYILYLYDLGGFRQASHMVEGAFNPFQRRKVNIKNGVEVNSQEISVKELYGGRISINLDAQEGFAAVMEQPGAFARVVGPQDRLPVNLGGFTHLRTIIDLKDQRVRLPDIREFTRDGIPVLGERFVFICRVAGSKVTLPRRQFQACDSDMIYTLVYRHWIGQDWQNSSKRRLNLSDLVSLCFRDFISQRSFIEFMPEMAEFKDSLQLAQNYVPLMDQFLAEFNHKASEHGLQIAWTGRGAWQLAEGLDPELLAPLGLLAYENWLNNHPAVAVRAGIQIRHEQVVAQIQRLVKVYDQSRQSGKTDDQVMLELGKFYLSRLRSTIRQVEARGEQPLREWLEVEKHLRGLVD
jgi:hypothetical protein